MPRAESAFRWTSQSLFWAARFISPSLAALASVDCTIRSFLSPVVWPPRFYRLHSPVEPPPLPSLYVGHLWDPWVLCFLESVILFWPGLKDGPTWLFKWGSRYLDIFPLKYVLMWYSNEISLPFRRAVSLWAILNSWSNVASNLSRLASLRKHLDQALSVSLTLL